MTWDAARGGRLGVPGRAIRRALSDLTNLSSLDLSNCTYVTQLPDDIGNQKKLQRLDLRRTGLEKLPRSLGSLKALTYLALSKDNRFGLPAELINRPHVIDFLPDVAHGVIIVILVRHYDSMRRDTALGDRPAARGRSRPPLGDRGHCLHGPAGRRLR